MSTTVIRKCNCESAYQDKKYGKGNRVHNNSGKKATGTPECTCTVCGVKR